jgi:hypothetical protein
MQLCLVQFAAAFVLACLIESGATAESVVTYSLDLTVPGTFKLRAQTSLGDNAGLAAYSVSLLGNVLTLDHRSPQAISSDNFAPVGFSQLRSPDKPAGAVNPTIIAAQEYNSAPLGNLIYGFGQQTSSYVAKGITPAFLPDATSDIAWTVPMVLATGTYTDFVTFDLSYPNLSASVFTTQGQRDVQPASVSACDSCPVITNGEIENVSANDPGFVSYNFIVQSVEGPLHGFGFDGFSPAPGASGTGPAIPATFDYAANQFYWNTVGSPLGTYKWHILSTNIFGTSVGYLTIHITAVPEPAALPLLALLTIAGFRFVERRRAIVLDS